MENKQEQNTLPDAAADYLQEIAEAMRHQASEKQKLAAEIALDILQSEAFIDSYGPKDDLEIIKWMLSNVLAVSKVSAEDGKRMLRELAKSAFTYSGDCTSSERDDNGGRADPAPTVEKKPCPVEREKLLIGLEFCREKDPEKCPDCPYYPIRNYCGGVLAGDALAYIGWLEEMEIQSGGVRLGVVFNNGKYQAVEVTE